MPVSKQVQDIPSAKACDRDGMAWALMVGLGETYVGACAIFLGATPFQIAFLATVPTFLGSCAQLLTVWLMRFFKSRKSVIVRAALINAVIWIPLAFCLLLDAQTPGLIYLLAAVVTVYQISGNFMNPLWNSLVGDLIPPSIRGQYFGNRNRKIGFCTFVGILVGGVILDQSADYGKTAQGFVLIFLLAGLARVVSVLYLAQYEDKPFVQQRESYFSLWDFIRRSPRSNFAKFVYFVSCINCAVAFSGPFFSLYMLRHLNFSYAEFTGVTAISTVSQFLAMAYWGKLTDHYGNKRILNFCAFGVSVNPILWLFGTSPYYLMFVQMFGGFMWAGFNLASANFLFDAVTPQKRARCAAYQSAVNAIFVLAGALLGGFMVEHLPERVLWWDPSSPLLVMFLLSGAIRFAATSFILPLFKEVRTVPATKRGELFFRITGLRPISGATFSIFTGGRKG